MANTYTQLASSTFPGTVSPIASPPWTTATGLAAGMKSVSGLATGIISAAPCGAFYSAATLPNDQYAEVTINATNNANNYRGPAVRMNSSGGGQGYFLEVSPSDLNVYLRIMIAGVLGGGGNGAVAAISTGDVFRIEVLGSTITLFQNGISKFSMTDTQVTSGSAGMFDQTITGNATGDISAWDAGSIYSGTVVSVGLAPSSVTYPTTSTGTVTLSAPAPTGDIIVNLSSSDITVATVPATVTVLAGNTTATFTVTSLNKTGSSTITGSIGGGSSANAALGVTAGTHSISGSAGLAGATVSWTGTASGSTTADGSGNYTIPSLADGSYTITPSNTGYSFSSTSSPFGPTRSVTVSGADVTGQDFTSQLNPVGSAGASDPNPYIGQLQSLQKLSF